MSIKGKKTAAEWSKVFTSKEFEREYSYLKNDLGYTYEKEKTTFNVWAPTATQVLLHLYTKGSQIEEDSKKIGTYELQEGERGVWSVSIKDDLKNLYYTYVIHVNGKTYETNDIYAKASGINGERSMIIDLNETNPIGWEMDKRPNIPVEERVIYELHIKDFSYDENSGIDEKYRGKYLAFTQKGTTLKGDSTFQTGIEYIKSLGVTYVHLLPFYDFGSVDERDDVDAFNWGYDPVNYNVPDGSYSTNAYDGRVRIKEVKEMVQAFHNEGIGVIMDVVYNHTFHTDSNLNRTVPYYYYRINQKGEYSDGSGCGNETASDRVMYRKYMIDSILHWAREYHLDGFRFDLMGVHDTETMNEIRKALDDEFGKNTILLYGEPWCGGATSMPVGSIPSVKEHLNQLDTGISAFCDVIRDFIKGSVMVEEEAGFINGNKKAGKKLKESLDCVWNGKIIEEFTGKVPRQFINYVSAHDNLTFWDKLIITNKKEPNFHSSYKSLIAQNKLGAGIVFTTCGIPFFQAGEEFGRTKEGIDNSYKSPASVNALDWKRAKQFKELVEFYKQFIQLRKMFPIFCNPDGTYTSGVNVEEKQGMIQVELIPSDEYKKKYANKPNSNYEKIVVFYNSNNFYKECQLEDKKWEAILLQEASILSNNKIKIQANGIGIIGFSS